ncbi:MAG: YcaO-like family protein [Hyphomicrobiales bacterium]|nr:YcaO-like family protein [Hyphomicrobiales bacterium]
MRPLASRMGITRIGNVTGLDRIGIPVAVAVRPNSRSVSVSQGKGLDLAQAMTSALMEAAEGFHGEELDSRFRYAAYDDLAARERVVDPARLCGNGRSFEADAQVPWIEGTDLMDGCACWVPAEIVHTDFTVKEVPAPRFFLAGGNGLASGNHLAEACVAAICEVVERDAVALWRAKTIRARAQRVVDPETVDDADCRTLLDAYAKAGVSVRIFDVGADIGIAAFACEIRAPSEALPGRVHRYRGSGSHPARAIALSRALTEAAQTRLTYITGIRDDLDPAHYESAPALAIDEDLLIGALQGDGQRDFREAPDFASDDIALDLRAILERLRKAGMGEAIAVELTRAEFGIPVVRVVIPGLEGDSSHPDYRRGARAEYARGLA